MTADSPSESQAEQPAPEAPAGPSEGTAASEQAAPVRPAFARRFPDHPELEKLLRAFMAGDYARVRSGAAPLADASDDPKLRRAARELLSRLEPDPLARYLLWVSIALLCVLIVFAYTHQP